nr:MAG TPA_asm: PROTEIN/DNA Complex catalytic motif, Helix-turn-helix DNA [Caudoviricetes sp.]
MISLKPTAMELTLEPVRVYRNRLNGQFLKGHPSYVKGKKWEEWMSKEGQEKALIALEKNRQKAIPPKQDKSVMMIKDGKEIYFPSVEAAHRATGINASNICACCKGKRNQAGGYKWYYYNSDEWLEIR